jgi:hypothetical protein
MEGRTNRMELVHQPTSIIFTACETRFSVLCVPFCPLCGAEAPEAHDPGIQRNGVSADAYRVGILDLK